MHDRIQLMARVGVSEYELAQARPIYAPTGYDASTELSDDGVETRAPRFVHRVGGLVGIDYLGAKLTQHLGHRRLSGSHATGQADQLHGTAAHVRCGGIGGRGPGE